MNKPIVQLIVFLFIVIFATFALLRFDTFHLHENIKTDNSMDLLLLQNKTALIGSVNRQSTKNR